MWSFLFSAVAIGLIPTVASLPSPDAQRRDINLPPTLMEKRALAEGFGFANPLETAILDVIDGETPKIAAAKAPAPELSQAEQLDQRLLSIGLTFLDTETFEEVRISSFALPGSKMSEPSLGKRATYNVNQRHCDTTCGFQSKPGVARANTRDCVRLYRSLCNRAEAFTAEPRTIKYYLYNTCAAFIVNNSQHTINYNYWDFGGATQYLNGACLESPVDGRYPFIGTCLFSPFESSWTGFQDGVYVSINHPSYFGV